VSALAEDPRFEPAGDFLTVDGMLKALGVEDAPLSRQRAAVREVAALATIRPWVDRLLPELRRRGLAPQ
jgi:hypothetical protein